MEKARSIVNKILDDEMDPSNFTWIKIDRSRVSELKEKFHAESKDLPVRLEIKEDEDGFCEIKLQSDEESIVTPWIVSAGAEGVNYDKIVDQFGCQKISAELLARFERVAGRKLHHLIRRGLFFAHRDLEVILTAKENRKPFYLYTGRGPSSEALHIGHLIPFFINKWLQESFGVPIVIQLTDDEKFLFKDGENPHEFRRLAYENAKDILACGFDIDRTLIFSNLDYVKELYPVALRIQKKTTLSQAKGIFGFVESDNIGRIAFPAMQCAPCFPDAFRGFLGEGNEIRCLIPCAIDQDPYFRMTRDIAPRLGRLKPSLILSKFIPSLEGSQSKMSGSSGAPAILVTDSAKQIRKKVMKYAFSGGRDTVEEHRKFGGRSDVDVSFQYLTFFLEDDEELESIRQRYETGELLTGELKEILATTLAGIIEEHQNNRQKITAEDLATVMNPNRLQTFANY